MHQVTMVIYHLLFGSLMIVLRNYPLRIIITQNLIFKTGVFAF